MKKRYTALLIILSLLLAGNVDAGTITEVSSGFCGYSNEAAEWTLYSDGTMYISGGTVVDSVDGWKNSNIKNVIIENGIKKIGHDAFFGLTGLVSVKLPESVTELEEGAFDECGNLEELVLPSGIKNIGMKMATHCRKLRQVVIPTGIEVIRENMFDGCVSLSRIDIPENVKTIKSAAFNECINLTQITIPESVTYIERDAFANCTGLESVVFEGACPDIETMAFKYDKTIIMYPDDEPGWKELNVRRLGGNISLQSYHREKRIPTQEPAMTATSVPTQNPTSVPAQISHADTMQPETVTTPVAYKNKKTNRLSKPVIKLKKGRTAKGRKCVIIILSSYKGNNIEIYQCKGNKKTRIKIDNSGIKKNNRRFKLIYSEGNTVFRLCVRTYRSEKGKKIRSPYSTVKKIRV